MYTQMAKAAAFWSTRAADGGRAAYQHDMASLYVDVASAITYTGTQLTGKYPKLAKALAAEKARPNPQIAGKYTLPEGKGKQRSGPTALIEVCIAACTLLDILNGFIPPTRGEEFQDGGKSHKLSFAELELADVDSRDWSGDAATKYADLNATLKELAAKMQSLDNSISISVSKHGDHVQRQHSVIAIALLQLAAAQLIAILLYLMPPPNGAIASKKFQLITVVSAYSTVFGFQSALLINSGEIADAVKGLSHEYRRVEDQARQIAMSASPDLSMPVQMNSVGVAAMSGDASRVPVPRVASLANLEGSTALDAHRSILSSVRF